MAVLSQLYLLGMNGRHEKCRKWIQLEVGHSDLDAKVLLGVLYIEGKAVKK